MLPPHKILLPVDYSERCFDISRHAVQIGRRFESEVTVLHVQTASLDAAGRKRAESRLGQFAGRELNGMNARPVIRCGEAAPEILRQAAEDETDLIMMPTRGFSSFRLLLLGSVTANVLHHASCPVWTGPHDARSSIPARIPPRHIVCAVALGCGASDGVAWACVLAQAYPAELTVVHVAPRAEFPHEACSEHWKSHSLPNDSAVITRQMLVETADASKSIPALARHLAADLLVLDRNPIGERRSRSEEYEIILGAPGSVLRL